MDQNDLIRKGILERNSIVQNNIFETTIEKADSGKVYGDPIGTVKQFKSGPYIKVGPGKWVPHKEGEPGPTVKTTKFPIKFEVGRDQRKYDHDLDEIKSITNRLIPLFKEGNQPKLRELTNYKTELEKDLKKIKSGLVYVIAKMHTNNFQKAKWENGKLISGGHVDLNMLSGDFNEMTFYGMGAEHEISKINDLYNSLKAMGYKNVWKSFGKGMGTDVARIGWDPIYKVKDYKLVLDINEPTKEPWENWEENEKKEQDKEIEYLKKIQRYGNYKGKWGKWNYETGIENIKALRKENSEALARTMKTNYGLGITDKDIEEYVAQNSDHTILYKNYNYFKSK